MVLQQRTGALVTASVLVAVVTACGAGGAGDDGKQGGGTSSSDGIGSRPLSAAELKRAALKDGDRVGDYRVTAYALGRPSEDAMEYRSDRAECQPLVSLAEGATDHDPLAEVNRRAHRGKDGGRKPPGPQVAVQLRSYGPGEAAEVLAALRRAGTACADGFTENRSLAKAPYLSVKRVEAPRVGDEAVAYRLRIKDVRGELTVTEYLTVVRSGANTLSFRLEPLSAEDRGGVPRKLVAAQWKAFERVAAR